MGRDDFAKLYKECKLECGEITGKISYFSDNFEANKNYAGIIVYKIDGKCKWKNDGIRTLYTVRYVKLCVFIIYRR